jgi:NAD(P)-dependent dehydrogenase (short-subunit alcohol dehydrogenase family)
VTDPDSLQSAIRATVDKFGRLDVLHNNAGGSTAQDDTAVNAPLDEFWRAIKLDLYGTFLGCRFGIPELIKAGGGSVINMSSNVALMGVAGRDWGPSLSRKIILGQSRPQFRPIEVRQILAPCRGQLGL